jgi:hypothetical protein
MRRWAALVAACSMLAARPASAQLTVGLGARYFRWSEQTAPVSVHENGPLLAGTLSVVAPRAGTVGFGYHGEGGIGIADYKGSFLAAPGVVAHSTTVFGTMSHEAQMRVRSSVGLEGVLAIGAIWWHRQLSATEQEDYQTIALSVSAERFRPRGLNGGAGIRFPLSVREDAHFEELGFDTDPTLKPRGTVGFFGRLRYRFVPHLAATASFERFRLEKSKTVTLTVRGQPAAIASQPETSLWTLGVGLEYSR